MLNSSPAVNRSSWAKNNTVKPLMKMPCEKCSGSTLSVHAGNHVATYSAQCFLGALLRVSAVSGPCWIAAHSASPAASSASPADASAELWSSSPSFSLLLLSAQLPPRLRPRPRPAVPLRFMWRGAAFLARAAAWHHNVAGLPPGTGGRGPSLQRPPGFW